MVDMERDVPGNIAESDWQMPIQMAWPRLISSTCMRIGFVAGGPRIDDPHDDAADEQRPGHHGEAAEISFAPLVQGQGNDRSAEEGNQREGDGVIYPGAVAALALGKASDEADDALEIEQHQREDRAGLDDDGVHLPVRIVQRDLHDRFGDAQMRGGTDGQKLGQALDDAQKY